MSCKPISPITLWSNDAAVQQAFNALVDAINRSCDPADDFKVKVDAADPTPDFLYSKLVAGPNIFLTLLPGVSEQIEIRAVGGGFGTDELVKIDPLDTTAGYLASKLVAGSNVALTTIGIGNEQLQVDVTIPPQPDQLVKIRATDTTADYLNAKVVAGAGISLSVLNPGLNEQLQITNSGAGGGGSGFTSEGGLYITAINDTGLASVKGWVLHPSTAVNGGVSRCPVGDFDPVGIMYEDGVANGQPVKVVISGWADVLVQAGYQITREYWVGAPGAFVAPPGVIGLAQTAAGAPATTDHFREIGHCLDDKLPKPLVVATLARCLIHFN